MIARRERLSDVKNEVEGFEGAFLTGSNDGSDNWTRDIPEKKGIHECGDG